MSRSRLDLDYLIGVLSRGGLISERQGKVISQKAPAQKEKLTKLCKVKRGGLSVLRCGDEITPVDVLASMGLKLGKKANDRLNEEAIMRMVAADLRMTFKKIDPLKLDLELVTQTIPKSFALKHMVLPVETSLETITVAVYDPFNRQVLEDIERVTKKRVEALISTKSDIVKTISEFYGFKSSIVAADTQLSKPLVDLGNLEQLTHLQATEEISSSDQHITNAVDHLFNYGFDQRASDVHIEPKREQTIVRLRIDGLLHTIYRIPKSVM